MSLISHRGAKGLAPENSIQSIQMASQLGVPYIEFDIQRTKDEHVVLFHNSKTSSNEHIAELTFKQVKQLYPDIAQLGEALKACGASTPLVEIKTLGTAKIALPLLKGHTVIAITSFISEEIIFLRKELPKAQTFIMQHAQPYGQIKKALAINASGIGINKNWAIMLPHYYWHARHNGLEIYTFTVNSSFAAALFLRFMPQLYICTDHPDKLQKISSHTRFINLVAVAAIGLIIFEILRGVWHA